MQRIDVDSYLRQTDPFRFVDEAHFCAQTGVITTSRRYVGDEEFFAGHFPGDPVVPGVILVESMAQSCRVWFNHKAGKKSDGFIASIDRAKFTKPVRPGDVVVIESRPLDPVSEDSGAASRFCRFTSISRCGNEEVAKASVTLFQKM